MRIGVLVNNSKSIFVNGCLQQGYFLMKCFRKKGYNTNFISLDKDFSKFELINEDVHTLVSTSDLDKYNLIIFSSSSVNDKTYLSYCKLRGIPIISLCVGNYYIINQEELVLDVHKENGVLARMNNPYVDASWLMPMYKHNLNYMKFISNRPVEICPYVWDSTFIDLYISEKKLNVRYSPKKNKLDILILEPNLSIHKSCLVPLLICEEFFLQNRDKLGKVYLFCQPKNDFIKKMSYLNIVKYNKIEYFDRVITMDLFDNLIKLDKKFTVLSSNIRNGLNFLHLECFKLGIPIVHNCKPFKNSGLYYEESDNLDDYPMAVKHLENIYIGNYIQNSKDILEKYNPENSINIDRYDELIKAITSNKTDFLKQLVTNVNTVNETSEYKKEIAIAFIYSSKNNESIIKQNINTLDKLGVKYRAFIFYRESLDINIAIKSIKIKNDSCFISEIINQVKYEDLFVIHDATLLEFNIFEIIGKSSFVGIKMEKNKELIENDYEYSDSFCKIIKQYFNGNGNNKTELFSDKFFYLKNTPKLGSNLNNIKIQSYLDEQIVLSILVNLFIKNITNLDCKKYLIGNSDEFCGYIYKNDTMNNILTVFHNVNTKNKSIIDSDKLYLSS